MSVSRDFIDFYSPKARDQGAAERFRHGATERKSAAITLAFGFRARHYLRQTPLTIRQAGCFFLAVGDKSLVGVRRRVASSASGLVPDRYAPSRMSSSRS